MSPERPSWPSTPAVSLPARGQKKSPPAGGRWAGCLVFESDALERRIARLPTEPVRQGKKSKKEEERALCHLRRI